MGSLRVHGFPGSVAAQASREARPASRMRGAASFRAIGPESRDSRQKNARISPQWRPHLLQPPLISIKLGAAANRHTPGD